MPFCRPSTLFGHYGCGGGETPLPGSKSLVQRRELRTESIATHESRQAGRKGKKYSVLQPLLDLLAAVELGGQLLITLFVFRQMLCPGRCESFAELWKI